jgi:vacuolar-type H+-ATPase subunit F/Vma7
VDASACKIETPRRVTDPLVSSPETQVSTIEAAFQEYTERKDVAILLINQHVRSSLLTLPSTVSNFLPS